MDQNIYRSIPSVDNLLSDSRLNSLSESINRQFLVDIIREITDEARNQIQKNQKVFGQDQLIESIINRVKYETSSWPLSVINATGVILHTNMGRAPLSNEALEAVKNASIDYSDLEVNRKTGKRGSRYSVIANVLNRLTGSQDAIVVNNNAAAMLLGLAAIAKGKEVIVSRGEASEIGGGFRIPDVLVQSGAKLIEVGTVNRTYAEDYEKAITPKTAAILLVHRSNFQVVGFTHEPRLHDIVQVGKSNGIPVLHDLGSGALLDTIPYGLGHEPMPQESIEEGLDLVFFSGDKLLGGPQSGIIIGNDALVAKLKSHPLARAIRPEKMTLAALHQTLLHYIKGEALLKIPVWKMISMPLQHLDTRARKIVQEIGQGAIVVDGFSTVGGGSLPTDLMPSKLISLAPTDKWKTETMITKLRDNDPSVIARIENDCVVFDLRTVEPQKDIEITNAIRLLI